MSYDANSPKARKGALGEKIVKEILEGWGYVVTRADKHGDKSLIDFFAITNNPARYSRYVEVKVRNTMPYAHGQYPCYSFPAIQIEAYRSWSVMRSPALELWIVDPVEKAILVGCIKIDEVSGSGNNHNFLHNKIWIDGKEFPFDQETKYGIYRFFHRKQFSTLRKLTEEETIEFSKILDLSSLEQPINEEDQTTRNEPIVKVADILTAPDGTNLDILSLEDDCRLFVKVARVSTAIGYKDPSIGENSPLITAASRLGVQWYRFPTQRLSGNDSYGKKAYYFNVEDVPKILAQYYEFNYKAKPDTRQFKYNQASIELRDWWVKTFPPPRLELPAKSQIEQIAAFANIGKAELIQAVLDLRQDKFDREQAQMKELLI